MSGKESVEKEKAFMEISNSYYESEVREGFYIPGMIKRSWAAQLEILKHVAEICEKHGIRWFADCGTLIGAVRHHGFIPWDDDLDISMLKDDYDRFLSVAEDELPGDYRILNIYREKNYMNFLTRIVNHSVIDTDKNFLDANHGFPYISGIDIFPLHYLSDNEELENERQEKANKIWSLLEEFKSKGLNSEEDIRTVRKKAEKISGLAADKNVPLENALYKLLDTFFSSGHGEKAEYAALIPFWIKEKNHRFPISIFNDTVKIAFENWTIPLPAGYEQLLKMEYGNWEKASRNGGLHNYPYYTDQESKLSAHRNEKLPYRYRFDKNDLYMDSADINDVNMTMMNAMENAHDIIERVADLSGCFELLCKCQELAVKIGENIEKEYPEESVETVNELEKYCELIYELNEGISDDPKSLKNSLALIKAAYRKLTDGEMIFIISKLSEWKRLESFLESFECGKENNISVMPVPYYRKNWSGELTDEKYDLEDIKTQLEIEGRSDIRILDYKKYNFAKKRDRICIVDPYDEYREAVSVHPFFYASNLRKLTGNLSYIHIIPGKTPGKDDARAEKNAKDYVISPAVLMADRIYLPDEDLREFYIKTLSEADDSVPCEYWEKKICVMERVRTEKKELFREKKCILFYTGISVFYTEGKKALDKLESVLKIFAGNREKIYLRWVTDTNFEEEFRNICSYIWDDYKSLKSFFIDNDLGEYILSDNAEVTEDCDAYYGSGGFLMNHCVNKGIPVMVWNTDV